MISTRHQSGAVMTWTSVFMVTSGRLPSPKLGDDTPLNLRTLHRKKFSPSPKFAVKIGSFDFFPVPKIRGVILLFAIFYVTFPPSPRREKTVS